MRVLYDNKLIDIEIGQSVTVFRVSSMGNYFGEPARLAYRTVRHLVFVTDSGAIVKTNVGDTCQVIGKAEKNGWKVSLKSFDELNITRQNVKFWDSKSCKFVTK